MSLLVEEEFSGAGYTSGANLNGLNLGTGWSAEWVCSAPNPPNCNIYSSGLTFTNVTAAGLSARIWLTSDGTVYQTGHRYWTKIDNTAGSVVWIALLGTSAGSSKFAGAYKFVGLETTSGGGTDTTFWSIGGVDKLTEQFPYFNGTQLFNTSGAHLVVYKITMSGDVASAVTVDCYVDPDPLTNPSTWGDPLTTLSTAYVLAAGLTGIIWSNGRASTSTSTQWFLWDEIRVATTSYEATGNAVPATDFGDFFMLF